MNKKYILIIVVLVIIFFIFSGFFLWKWRTDKNLLTNQLNGVQEDVKSYKEENETIKTENETLKTENINLKENIVESSSSDQIAGKVMNYVNKNLVQQGTTASFVGIAEESGIYKLKVKVGTAEPEVYVTKNGKLLFIQGVIDMSSVSTNNPTTDSGQKKATCENLKKTNEAFLEAFIVSNCPYGLQMQRILSEIVENTPSLAQYMEVRYMGAIENGKITSMHGDKEAQENLRQICIREEQASKYWDYVACYMKNGETDNCLASVNIGQASLAACMSNGSRGLEYAKDDFDLQDKLSVSGSPTLFLNKEKVSEFDFGGRTAEATKTLLCCGFNTKPATCSKKLASTTAATSFSETYTSSSGGSSGGGCGQ